MKISLETNTRATIGCTKSTGGSTTTKKHIIPKLVTQQKDRAEPANGMSQRQDDIPTQEGKVGGDIPYTPVTTDPRQLRPPKE
jgi:hypothetical protein